MWEISASGKVMKELNKHPQNIHCVSKNVPPLVRYNFDTRERILIFLVEMLSIK